MSLSAANVRDSDKVAGSRCADVRACEFPHRPGAGIRVSWKPTRRIGQRDAARTRSRDGCATLPGDFVTGAGANVARSAKFLALAPGLRYPVCTEMAAPIQNSRTLRPISFVKPFT